MAFKIKDELDLSGFAITKFCIDSQVELPTDDGTIGTGRKVFYTGTGSNANHEYVYNGTAWKALAFLDEVTDNEVIEALGTRVGTLETMLNTQDAEGVINTWNEIQTFLDSVQEGTDLMDLLNSKFDKSGGTIESESGYMLTLNRLSDSPTLIAFQSRGTLKGFIGIATNGEPLYLNSNAEFYTLLHSGNYANQIGDYYLKTSGGILTSSSVPLTIDRTNGYSTIAYNCDGGMVGVLGFSTDGTLIVSPNRATNTQYFNVLHSGNCTSYYAGGLAHSNGAVGATVDANGNVSFNGEAVIQIDGNEVIGKHSNLYIGYQTAVKDSLATRIWGKGFFFSNEAGAHRMVINESGNVTIGGSDLAETGAKLYVDGNIHVGYDADCYIGAPYSTGDNTAYNRIVFKSSGSGISYYSGSWTGSNHEAHSFRVGTANTSALTIMNSGNVGIGTTNPQYELDVAGNVGITSTNGYLDLVNGHVTGNATLTIGVIGTSYAQIQTSHYGVGYTCPLSINPSGGNVLIGTDADDNSGAKLQVNGRIKGGVIDSIGGIYVWSDEDKNRDINIVWVGSVANFYAYEGTYYDLCFGLHSGSARSGALYFSAANNSWGIGTTAPEEKLHVVGNLYVTGNIIADGEVSAGGAGAEGSGSGGGASVYQEVFTPSTTTVGITHNLGTEDVIITLYEWDSTISRWSMCLTDIEIVDANNIEITFGSTSSVQHKVVVMGGAA